VAYIVARAATRRIGMLEQGHTDDPAVQARTTALGEERPTAAPSGSIAKVQDRTVERRGVAHGALCCGQRTWLRHRQRLALRN
jgi:hypothetical protein